MNESDDDVFSKEKKEKIYKSVEKLYKIVFKIIKLKRLLKKMPSEDHPEWN